MKGFKLAAAASAVAIGLGAMGAATANTVQFNLTGEVSGVCVVTDDTGSETVDVSFGDLGNLFTTTSVVRVVDLDYDCNILSGFDRNISSDNGGYMVNGAGDPTLVTNQITYEVEHSDNAGVANGFGFSWLSLTPSHATADVPAVQSTEQISFRTYGIVDPSDNSATKFEGNYSDTVYLTITAN